MPAPTANQKLALERLAEADEQYRHAKRDLEAILRAEVKERLEKFKAKRDLLAFAAKQAGATPTMIAHDGLHTTNRSSAYEAIANGEAISSGPQKQDRPSSGIAQSVLASDEEGGR